MAKDKSLIKITVTGIFSLRFNVIFYALPNFGDLGDVNIRVESTLLELLAALK